MRTIGLRVRKSLQSRPMLVVDIATVAVVAWLIAIAVRFT